MAWWALAILVFLLIAAYLGIGALAADRLTLPQRVFDPNVTPATVGLDFEPASFPARDGSAELAGWFIPAGNNQQAVVMVHGRDASRTAAMGGHFVELAKALHDAGLAVLMFDLRGHGTSSDGRFTFGLKERQDVLGAVDFLRDRGVPAGKIGVLGLSLGAAAGIGAAAVEPAIGAVATDSAFADINPLIDAQWDNASGLPRPLLYSALLMARPLVGVDITQARPVAEIGQVAPRPLLLMHCAEDNYIPAVNLETLHAAAPQAKTWLIPGSGCRHAEAYGTDPTEYAQKVTTFFTQSLQ